MNEPRKLLPEPTLRRLPWYLAYLDMLRHDGVLNVSSTALAKALSIDSAQIAKDLSFLDVKGKTRIGYNVDELRANIYEQLGFGRLHNAVIVGVGNLGAALLHDGGLAAYGLAIKAGFDIDPQVVNSEICGVPIYPINQMHDAIRRYDATIGILTVPSAAAQEIADELAASGLKAIWNFTPTRVKVAEGIVLTNTSIYAHLALIYNRLENNTTP